MNSRRLDDFARRFATASRRTMLAASIVALSPLAGRAPEPVTAKKKKQCKGKKRNKCRGKECGGKCGECRGGETCCDGRCVDTSSDPRNCGGCEARCALNELCDQSACVCPNCTGELSGPELTCCPPGSIGGVCAGFFVGGDFFADPASDTCAVSGCPAERQCSGPEFQACCPPGSICDTRTGVCLQ